MSTNRRICPICGNHSDNFAVDSENLGSLVWGNLPRSAHLLMTRICKMEAHRDGRQNENPEARI
jgi:hypothetical protein